MIVQVLNDSYLTIKHLHMECTQDNSVVQLRAMLLRVATGSCLPWAFRNAHAKTIAIQPGRVMQVTLEEMHV